MLFVKQWRCVWNNWGLNHVLSLTVDNASSNDVGVERLKRRLLSKNSLVMSGNHFSYEVLHTRIGFNCERKFERH